MKPLVWIPQHFGALLFDRTSSRYLPFDHEAAAVLRALIDRPAGEVIDAHPDPDAALGLVVGLAEQHLLSPDDRLPAAALDAEPPEDHLLGPLAVHLEIVGACNLSCGHCFAAPLPRHRDPLTLDELRDLFGQLAAVGAFRLGLTGGEPLLRRDLLDILDAATDAGLHPCLTTNGLLLTESMARALAERPLIWLNVSLDGATAETNDALRGAGTFDAVLRRLQVLREHARFTLAFTLTRHNLHEIERCVELADAVGAHTAVFRPLYPTGAALERPDLMPDFVDYTEALRRIAHADVRPLDPFSPQARAVTAGKVHDNDGCGAANTVCSISVQGQVNPCSFLGPDFEAGSVRERPFRELWDAGWSFARLRDTAGEDFQGGCRARSQALAGSVHARDPWEAAWRAGVGEAPDRTLELCHG